MEIHQDNQDAIDIFVDALWLESGLSKNTLSAYRPDLNSFAKFIEPSNLLKITQSDVQKFLAFLLAQGTKSSSSARVLSTLRRFYRYQIRENRISTDDYGKILDRTQRCRLDTRNRSLYGSRSRSLLRSGKQHHFRDRRILNSRDPKCEQA